MTATEVPSGLRILLGYARQQRTALAAGALFTAAGGLAAVVQPLVAKEFVETLGSANSVLRLLGVLGLLVVGGAVLNAAGVYVVGRAAESIVLSARRDLIIRILRLKVRLVDRLRPGDLLSRVTADTTLLRTAATDNLIDLGTGAMLLVGMVALMGYLDLVLLTVLLGVVITVGVATGLVLPRIGKAAKQSQEALGEMAASLERVLGAIRTVKANGAELREATAADRGMLEAWRQGLKATLWRSVAGVSSGLTIQVSFLAILAIGGARVASGALPVSSLIAFLLYLFYLTGPIAQLVTGASGLQAGLAAARRIREVSVLEVEPSEAAASGAATASAVTFQDVVFRYREDGPTVLNGVTVKIPPGGLTAVVGLSGAGKSTLFGILERFHDVESGSASVAGCDVRDWRLPDLRAHIGYVEQDAPVLSGTLRENLLLGAPDATEDYLVQVIARTRLADLVDRLPDGLDTWIGHRGMTLSGGERQRIAIARALLRRPSLLLLDEATSQLDAANEAALRDVIADLARTTTVIAVAHRLSTVTTARQILVLDDGRIRSAGTHEELLRMDTLYRSLAATQLLEGTEPAEAALAMEAAAQ